MRTTFLLFLALSLAACCGTQQAGFVPAAALAGASPCSPCQPAGLTFAAPQPVGATVETGPMEYAKATLAIPANLIGCVADFARCVVNQLFPVVQPTFRPVYGVIAMPPAAAAPCAAPAPSGHFEYIADPPKAAAPCEPPPAAKVPCPEPVASAEVAKDH